MLQVAQNMHLFHELLSAFVASARLHIVLHCHGVLHVPASRYFAIPSLAYRFNDLDIFLLDQKI